MFFKHLRIRAILIVLLVCVTSLIVIAQDDIGSSEAHPAELCDPAEPQLIDLADMAEFGDFEDSGVIDGAIVLPVRFGNERGQTFELTVTSMETDAIEAYLDGVQLCVEVLEIDIPEGRDAEGTDGVGVLSTFREFLAETTGLPYNEFVTSAQMMLAAGFPTLPEALMEMGGDVDMAYQLVEEFGIDVELFEAEGMPLLGLSDFAPTEDQEYIDLLQAEPLSVVISIEALDYAEEYADSDFEAYVAYYIDPTYTFSSESRHYYRSKCTSYAFLGLVSSNNPVGSSFWRYSPYKWLPGVASSGPWDYNTTTSRPTRAMTHDVKVYRVGGVGTRYTIYGGWYRGWGGDSC